MKLNEIVAGKVWLLVSEEDYESNYVHGIYTSKALATKDIKKFEEADWSKKRNTFVKEVKLNEFNQYDWSEKP